MMSRIYASFIAAQVPIVSTDIESAEIIKFASNGLLATKVAFINEIAQLCEKTTANVNDVARGMGLDPRIGAKFLQAGPGFGGSCFPKDSRALVAMAEAHGVDMQITRAVVASNETTKGHMVAKILELVDNEIAGKTILVLGVTFKPDTDDMREAPALDILPPLVDGGAVLHIVDPEGRKNGEAAFPAAVWFEDAYEAAEQADIVVVLTEWQTFRQLDLMRLRLYMRGSAIADLRNIYPPEALKQAGFTRIAQVGVAMV
jgi:UDPglucose 6-dehydrogenase